MQQEMLQAYLASQPHREPGGFPALSQRTRLADAGGGAVDVAALFGETGEGRASSSVTQTKRKSVASLHGEVDGRTALEVRDCTVRDGTVHGVTFGVHPGPCSTGVVAGVSTGLSSRRDA